MKKLLEAAKIVAPNFNNLNTDDQYKVLKRLEPEITPEDMIADLQAEKMRFEIADNQWGEYLKYYFNA